MLEMGSGMSIDLLAKCWESSWLQEWGYGGVRASARAYARAEPREMPSPPAVSV